MEILLGILLYIGAITTDVPYTTNDIANIEAENNIAVTEVQNNPEQLDASIFIFTQKGDKVIVLEEEIAW